MRSVMRMRHYCDHCKKSMGTKPAMVKHESGCTANPERKCRVCELNGEVQLSMPELQAAFSKGFKALIEACHNCPACILATNRQFFDSIEYGDSISWDDPRNTERGTWDFKTAMAEFWKNYNEEHRAETADYF